MVSSNSAKPTGKGRKNRTTMIAISTLIVGLLVGYGVSYVYHPSYQDSISSLESQVEMLQGSVTSREARISSLQSEIDQLEEELASANKNILSLQSQVTQLQTDLSARDKSLTTFSSQLNQAEATISAQLLNISSLKSDVSQLETQLATARSKYQELAESIFQTSMRIKISSREVKNIPFLKASKDDMVVGFISIIGGDDDINFGVKTPSGNIFFNAGRVSEQLHFNFIAPESGIFQAVLDNSFAYTPKDVFVSMVVVPEM